MSALALDRAFLLPRPGRLLPVMACGIFVPLAVLVLSLAKAPSLATALFTTLMMVAQVATALTTAHKEILAASPSFFHAGLRRGLLQAQLGWAFGEAALVAVFIALAGFGAGPAVVATAFGAALAVHALLALATLRLTWSYQLPFWILYLFFALPSLTRAGYAGKLDAVLGTPAPWLVGGVLLLWLLGRNLVRPHLHRRLCGTMVLGLDDVFKPGRIQEYRRRGEQHRHSGQGPRVRRRAIGALLGRADVAQQAGRTVAVRMWQVLTLAAAVNISTRRRVLVLIAVGMVFFMAYLGYYDGRKDTQGMVHWFAGLAYQAALYPIYGLAVVLLSAPAGGISRRNAFRAELATLGLLALASLGISVLITVGFHAMAAVLPPVTWHGREFVFTAPRLHCLWLPPLLVPFAWITVALRPKPLCTTANVVLGPAFVLSHWLMNSVPYQRSVPLFVGISILLFAVAFVVRRRWWEQADLAI